METTLTEAGERPPLPTWSGGKPLVDVANREALYEAIDAERDVRLYGKRAYQVLVLDPLA